MVSGRLRWPLFSFAIGARVDTPATAQAGSGKVESWVGLATADVCVHWEWFGACALLHVGGLRAAGIGLPDARRAASEYAALGGSILARFEFAPGWALIPRVDVLGVLTRVSLFVDESTVWVTSPASLCARLGLEWALR